MDNAMSVAMFVMYMMLGLTILGLIVAGMMGAYANRKTATTVGTVGISTMVLGGVVAIFVAYSTDWATIASNPTLMVASLFMAILFAVTAFRWLSQAPDDGGCSVVVVMTAGGFALYYAAALAVLLIAFLAR